MTSRLLLGTIILVYLATASLYALNTPPWQTPDEPAHYNYIAYLATQGKLPVLQEGDWDQDYLEFLKANKFPSGYSIASLRYESHQPPLYYALAAPLYLAMKGLPEAELVVRLRLISVFLGAILLILVYRLVRFIFPEREFVALTATALIAVIPQHLATTAAVNNDALAEVILALILSFALPAVWEGRYWGWKELTRRRSLVLGVLLGLALLTKTTIYLPTMLAIGAALWWTGRRWLPLLTILGIALLISGWWFVRNTSVYGDQDLFGWARHDAVVVGQPTTAQWLDQYGREYLATAFLTTSFHSFWGQFGWMGVVMDDRIYQVLLATSIAVGLGFLIWLWRFRHLGDFQKSALILFGLLLLAVTLTYLGYNLRFVQHQGRYLFPALVPIAIFFALGLAGWAGFTSSLFARFGKANAPRSGLLTSIEAILFLVFYLGFVALDLVALFRFIVPQLTPAA